MMKEKLNISASNIVNVCIDNIDGVERSGRFYCYYSKDPIFFRSIHELFRYMERFMNELNFPQSSTELRTYEDKQQKPANEKRISFTEVSNREQILEQRGNIDTLAVYVRYRQSATWQGTVTDEDEFTWYKVSYEEAQAYVRSDMAEVVETEEQGTENEDANEEAEVQVEDEVTYSQKIDNVVVNATASKGVLPDDAQFVVTPIKSEDEQ